jgi:transposase-like protein
MIPLKTFVSERRATNLAAQDRCRDSIYRVVQRFGCKNCGLTLDDKTDTVFENSAVALRKCFLAVHTYIRLNTSLRQLGVEIDFWYKTTYRRVKRPQEALDAPRPRLEGPVKLMNCA